MYYFPVWIVYDVAFAVAVVIGETFFAGCFDGDFVASPFLVAVCEYDVYTTDGVDDLGEGLPVDVNVVLDLYAEDFFNFGGEGFGRFGFVLLAAFG